MKIATIEMDTEIPLLIGFKFQQNRDRIIFVSIFSNGSSVSNPFLFCIHSKIEQQFNNGNQYVSILEMEQSVSILEMEQSVSIFVSN